VIARRFIPILVGLLAAPAVFAQALNYAQRTTTIRAGTLIIESQRTAPVGGIPINPEPHVWYNLDLDNGAKPASWDIVNPRAQTVLTQSLRDRWVILGGAGTIWGPVAGAVVHGSTSGRRLIGKSPS
jgi:hypothetical protein